jgi:hypothetical protein
VEAGQLEFGADAQVRGVFEPLVRSATARERRSRQHLEAEDGTVGETHDRLRRHLDRSRAQELLDQSRQRFPTDRQGDCVLQL